MKRIIIRTLILVTLVGLGWLIIWHAQHAAAVSAELPIATANAAETVPVTAAPTPPPATQTPAAAPVTLSPVTQPVPLQPVVALQPSVPAKPVVAPQLPVVPPREMAKSPLPPTALDREIAKNPFASLPPVQPSKPRQEILRQESPRRAVLADIPDENPLRTSPPDGNPLRKSMVIPTAVTMPAPIDPPVKDPQPNQLRPANQLQPLDAVERNPLPHRGELLAAEIPVRRDPPLQQIQQVAFPPPEPQRQPMPELQPASKLQPVNPYPAPPAPFNPPPARPLMGTVANGMAANGGLEGTGQPGRKQLEGLQAPSLKIEKFAPEGLQINKPATFRVVVKNVGPVAAQGVEIHDQIPKGCQLVSTKPQSTRGVSGELVWNIGTINPGDEVIVEMHLVPLVEGEIGSVATVRFNTEASIRATVTRPALAIVTTAPKSVLINGSVTLNVTVSNPGTGVATGVVLNEHAPPGLRFAPGTNPKCEIGTLRPGETQQWQVTLTAVQAGAMTNLVSAEADGAIKADNSVRLEVIAPRLEIGLEGPKRRYLNREATYTFSVANPGTAPAKQVELVAYLPQGLKFVSANNYGHYEPTTQSVHWAMDELPARDHDNVQLVALPIEAGDQKLRLEGRAEQGLSIGREQPISIEGIAAVQFDVKSLHDPVEVGGENMYEIRVVNQGSKAASNVRITAMLPPGMRLVAAEGPARYTTAVDRVQFESLARLAPKADTTYRVRVQTTQSGDLRLRVLLQTDEMQEPVIKEESTRVYKDE